VYTHTEDTIVAISSAPGGAVRGIVRLSGPEALVIADRLCVAAGSAACDGSSTAPGSSVLRDAAGFSVHTVELSAGGWQRAPGDVYVFRAPHSYTRQDLVELHTVGAAPWLDLIVERCIAWGARLAHPGEFTARAFLSGAMSLARAESVAVTIQARSDAQLRAAQRMGAADLTRDLNSWQDELTDLRALVEADMDFAEEPIDFIQPAELSARLGQLQLGLEALATTAQSRDAVETLPRVLLLGPPNAGKSTLFNRLSGVDRAIASAVAGTTRDILSACAVFGGIDVLLLDSAGIDDADDLIARISRERSTDAARSVDLVCYVHDAEQPPPADQARASLPAGVPVLAVANKIDLLAADEIRRPEALPVADALGYYPISARTGAGVAALRSGIAECLSAEHRAQDDVQLALSARQRAALAQTADALARCRSTADQTDDLLDVAEFLAADLREAADALAELTGAVTTEDLLGRIFGSFCIGK
jgi:tRNA modification GTPase